MHTADRYSSGCSQGSSSPGSVCFSSFVGTRRWTAIFHLHHRQHGGFVLVQLFHPHSFFVDDPQSSHNARTSLRLHHWVKVSAQFSFRDTRSLSSFSLQVLSRDHRRHAGPRQPPNHSNEKSSGTSDSVQKLLGIPVTEVCQ